MRYSVFLSIAIGALVCCSLSGCSNSEKQVTTSSPPPPTNPAPTTTGAGKSGIPCQGTIISPTDDIVSIINNGTPGQTFCIEGEHRITSTIYVKSGQSLIGTTTNSRISGAVVLSPWQPTSTQGVYYYDGPYANTQPHQQM